MGWRVPVAVMALAMASCAATVPVAVVSKGVPGGIMRGTNTASLSGGSFNVSSGKLSCGGSYDALDTSPTMAGAWFDTMSTQRPNSKEKSLTSAACSSAAISSR